MNLALGIVMGAIVGILVSIASDVWRVRLLLTDILEILRRDKE